MMRVIVNGIGGTMGKVLYNALKAHAEAEAVAGADKYADPSKFDIPVYDDISKVKEEADCIIDFSVKDALPSILAYAVEKKLPCVLATTGYGEKELALIKGASEKIAIYRSGNMSVGVSTLVKLVKEAAAILYNADVEIVEQHHHNKVDAPSGTALLLADAVKTARKDLVNVYGREGIVGKRKPDELGIHAVRGGSIVGKHEVMFIMNNEVVTLKHEAENKGIFAEGAIRAGLFLVNCPPGQYDMQDLTA